MKDLDPHLRRPSSMPSYSREAWDEEAAKHAIGFHVTMRLADGSGIARTPSTLRLGSRIVLRHGEHRGLLAHAFADTHVHAILIGAREVAGMFAHGVEVALRRELRLCVPFERCRIRPIVDERHLHNGARYTFTQGEHHGAPFDEAHDGSSLVDLLGLRMGATWIATRLRSALPRVSRRTLLAWLGVPELDEVLPDARYMIQAAAAAWGVGSLRGNTAQHIGARRTAVHMLDRMHPGADVAEALGITSRSATRYRSQTSLPQALRAVELQLKLRTHHAQKQGGIIVL